MFGAISDLCPLFAVVGGDLSEPVTAATLNIVMVIGTSNKAVSGSRNTIYFSLVLGLLGSGQEVGSTKALPFVGLEQVVLKVHARIGSFLQRQLRSGLLQAEEQVRSCS